MSFQAYLSDIAVTALFGVGYYLFRNKPVQTKKNIRNNTKHDVNMKISLKEKLGLSCDQLINKTETIEELSLLLKEKILKLKYNINNINLPNIINPTKVLSHIHCKKLIPNMEIYNYLLEVIVGLNNIESMRILEEELFDDTCPVSINESTLLGFLKGMKIKSLIYQENLKHAFENDIETENNQDFVVQKSYLENIILEIEKVLSFFSNRYVEINTIEVFNECLEIMTTPLTSSKVFEYYENNNSMFKENHETYRILLTAIKEKWSLHIYSNSKGIKSICDQSTNKNLCSLFLVSDDSEKEESLIIKAFELFNDAASKGLCSQELLHSLFEICVLCNDYEKLNELISLTKLSYTKFLNSETYSLLIKCFEVKEDFETAYSYFEEFKKQRLIKKQTISSLTSSSKSVINSKSSLLKTIIQKTIDKEEDNYSLSNSEASTQVSSTEISCSILEVYSSIIQCAIKTKKTDKIEDLLRECSDISNNLPESLLVALFSYYKSSKKIIKALELYELKVVSVKTSFPYFSVLVFNSMIDCCVENGKYDVMESIFNNMNDETKNSFPLPELTSYALMTRGYCKANNHDKVLDFYYYLLYFQNQGEYKIEESLCNSIIDCFARNKDEKNCIKIFNELKRSMKNKISIMTYGIIIKLYVNIDNLDKVLFYFNEICNDTRSSGINELKPSIIIYQLIMKCMIKNRKIESAVDLFKDMINNKNIKPDFLIFELLIKNCFEANLIETAFDLIADACRFEIRLENFLYEAAISAIKSLDCNDLNRKKHLVGLIKAIKGSKVQISRKTADMFNELIIDLKENIIKNTNSTVTQNNKSNGILNIEEIFLKENQTFIQINEIKSALNVSNEEELIVFGGNADSQNEDINELRIDVQNIRPFEEEDIGANSRKKINKKNTINITQPKANDDHSKLIYNSISFPKEISLKNSKSNQTPMNDFYYNETNANNSNIVDNLFGIRNNNYRNSFPQKKPFKKFNNNNNKSDNYATNNDQHTVGSLYSSKNVSQYNSSIYNNSNNKQGNSYYNNTHISAFRKSIYD